ncbi:MAG: winged helix-turn-helix transcriptional regulator [Thermoplasmata archaeon]|nr:winged helix-turn-helix transcriptional regulator [Thermoplasmata archaeon]
MRNTQRGEGKALKMRTGKVGVPWAGVLLMLASLAILQGATGLTVDHESDAGLPGDDIVFEFSATNEGAISDVLEIAVNATEAWAIAHPASVNVPAGGTKNFTMTVTVDDFALVGETAAFNVHTSFRDSGVNATVRVTVEVLQVHDVAASLMFDTTSAAPSRTARLSVSLTNLGNGPEIVNLTVIGPRGTSGDNATEYLLTRRPVGIDANTTRPIIIALSVSPLATPNSSFEVKVYANSSGGQNYLLPATVRVEGYDVWARRINVTGERGGKVIATGIQASVKFETSYWGDATGTLADLRLVVNGPDSTPLGEVTAPLRTGDGGSRMLAIDIPKPDSVPYGDLTVSAEVWHSGIMWSSKRSLVTLIEPDHTFEVRCDATDRRFGPGAAPVGYLIEIDNRGNVGQSFDVLVISQWDFAPSFSNITLVPRDVALLNVTLTPPADANGTIVAIVQVRSRDTDEMLPVTLRARVEVGGAVDEFPYVLVVMAIVAAVGCGFYFTRTESGWLSLLSLLPLYYRVTGQEVLDNYIRGKIHGYIIANPGDHYNGIREALGINNGTLAYHIKVLEREHLIKSRMDGKFKRFYPYESAIPRRKLTPIQRLLVERLAQDPGISQRKLARAVGESVQVVNYHVRNLEVSGVVEVRKMGNRSQCYVAEGWK